MEDSQLILLNTGYSAHHSDWNWKEINSPFTRIYYVDEGAAQIHLPGFTQDLRPGYLYLIPPFTVHSYECKDYFSHYYIHIYENRKRGRTIFESMSYPTEVEASSFDYELVKRLLEINPNRELRQFDPKTYDNRTTLLKNIAAEKQESIASITESRGILLQLLSRFLQSAREKSVQQDERVKKGLDYIFHNINKSIKISELAEVSNLSEDHFIRLFKQALGETPNRYINRCKIERAQVMLVVEKSAIKDVAYSLAFENISYFNRVFKQFTGYSPSQYQALLCENRV